MSTMVQDLIVTAENWDGDKWNELIEVAKSDLAFTFKEIKLFSMTSAYIQLVAWALHKKYAVTFSAKSLSDATEHVLYTVKQRAAE